ncbi:MAG: hypothetical protein WD898_01120 [Candidatus Paceibacterota bacterium]
MDKKLKKKIYILAFILFGIIIQFIIHAVVEGWYIILLVRDYDKYGFGLSWDSWFLIHHIFTLVLLVAGILFGWQQGKHWWHELYEKK